MPKLIANALLFQLGWFACVFGGDGPWLLLVAAALGVHLFWVSSWQAEGKLLLTVFFAGSALQVAGHRVNQHAALELDAGAAVDLVNGDTPAECLVLQGRPIAEPVAQYGPFVMNTQAEIQQAFSDYQRTRFGGWPWGSDAPHHGPARARFARHPGGREEVPA